MKKNILIVGGTGFIGFNLIKRLSPKIYKITCISKKIPKNKIKNVYYKTLDISKKNYFKKIKKSKFDIIINLGGNIDHSNKKETIAAHFIGCKNLIDLLYINEKTLLIQIGSSVEYGKIKSPNYENSQCKPISHYAIAKFNATKYIIKKSKEKNFSYVILRAYSIFGPNQKFDRLIPYVIKSCLQNKKFPVSKGSQLRDFLYIDDFTNLVIKILSKKNINSGIYNVGSAKPIKVKKIIKIIKKIIKKGSPIFGGIKMRRDEPIALYPSIKKVSYYFNWKPKYNILSGLKRTIKTYAS